MLVWRFMSYRSVRKVQIRTIWSLLNYLLIYFWPYWGFTAECGLSLLAASGAYSLVVVLRHLTAVDSLVREHRPRHRLGSCSSWAPECGLSSCGIIGLTVLRYMESSVTKDWTRVPCISRRIVNHWTTQGSPDPFLFFFPTYISSCGCTYHSWRIFAKLSYRLTINLSFLLFSIFSISYK